MEDFEKLRAYDESVRTTTSNSTTPLLGLGVVSGSNCSKCVFFRYEASWGHGWCYNDNSQYSGKLRGNGPSCNLDTSKR